MSSRQPSGPPPPKLGLPGQASLVQAVPGAPRTSSSTWVEELESSFEACFASLVLEDINVQHEKSAEVPQGSLVYLEQASANIPVPLKQT
ncbi:Mediator of RNA polymerase II transcription subunit 28 [Sciurus carolinensis]|uniref:Mediator of RNA polymerase II transcription subunit 28 n=1 Tax=Sciurus carolinensis TaxID=30640 RepID=A0AA41MHF8_SCICA|nr:Mediator of RNA polymerase II transcription subunit 28 [Sciurus carolinensis]